MGETLRKAREQSTEAQWEHLARYRLEDVVEVEDKDKAVSVLTTKIHEVEVHLHSFLTSTVDRDVVVSFMFQPPYSLHPQHRRPGGHQCMFDRSDKYFAPPPPPNTVQIEMLDEHKHKRKLKKVDVKFQQARSRLVQGGRNNKRVAYCRTEP
jgi:hypothetical protein